MNEASSAPFSSLSTVCASGRWSFQPVFVPADQTGGAPAGKVRILVVEDNFLIAMDTEYALRDAGFDVVGVAASAAEATTLARDHRPDLAIMDIRLIGQRDGVDAALEIYKETGIRCLFASAHGDAQTRGRAQPAEPLGWLSKPYDQGELIEAVLNALSVLRG